MTTCRRCGMDNSFINHPELRFCIRCGEKLIQDNEAKKEDDLNLMTPLQVCEALGVTKQTLYQYVHRNQIPHIKIGKNLRFDRSVIKKIVTGGNGE